MKWWAGIALLIMCSSQFGCTSPGDPGFRYGYYDTAESRSECFDNSHTNYVFWKTKVAFRNYKKNFTNDVLGKVLIPISFPIWLSLTGLPVALLDESWKVPFDIYHESRYQSLCAQWRAEWEARGLFIPFPRPKE